MTTEEGGVIKKPALGRYATDRDGNDANLTQAEIQELIEKEVAPIRTFVQKLRNYYRRGYPTFEITGGNDIPEHDLAEYQLDTESGQGLLFTNTGNAKILGNSSVEVVSNGKKSGGGGFDKDAEAGIVLYAKDGVIHIESVMGTVNIRAHKNIQLEAGQDINLIAKRDVTIEAKGSMITDVGVDSTVFVDNDLVIDSGGTMSLHSERQDIETSCGTDQDVCDFHTEIKTDWDKIDALNNFDSPFPAGFSGRIDDL